MKKVMFILLMSTLSGCGGTNSDGSDKSTYSSCKIIQSSALFASDREHDLSQCWNASGNGYESQGNAMQWCASTVDSYMSERYLMGHSVTYSIGSTYCP